MEPRGRERHRWENRKVEWSSGEKRHRRQSREGSGEEAGTRPSFKWAGAHESMRAASEFNRRPSDATQKIQSGIQEPRNRRKGISRSGERTRPRVLVLASCRCNGREATARL